ncbi:NNP family nitrate/nitrite transporter-like MFS transporter [Roseiarcus fermentans]|uniref:NNP family nitrate/nitrite transporter-like MFS transporter n=1 Tax=Roseiarcus fermentans TaxID=1473586 RepID=A0A366EEY3_9HYPH|nr:nitrate/nitrite transporter [Roseiarcus fermentans]RBP00952.1 NNP family nitrate/nitrite transporter-like MFS transporter [Roseiarcus fermentans]
MNRGFLRAGHLPTLFSAFLYFDVSFMVWVILGPLGVFIARDLHLSSAEKGLMVATPVLAGAVLRIVAGVLADYLKPRLAGVIMQTIVIGGLAAFWAFGLQTFASTLALGIVLGVAGASFAVALPLASYWYPPEHQGAALGVAGAGNSGTVLAALFAPSLAVLFGWRNVLGLAIVPLAIVLALFVVLAKNSPHSPARRSLKDYADVLSHADAWWLMAFYCVTFGGFVGLSSFLPIYFNDQYGLSPVNAGYATAACVFAGSFVRPIGGAIADRIGGVKALSFVYGLVAVLVLIISRGLPDLTVALPIIVVTMGALGAGNGAVFQIVPQRFSRNVGVVTGLVGATGGAGGFYLAASLGYAKQFAGGYGLGFAVFACLALAALTALTAVSIRWRRTWLSRADLAAA